MFSALSNKYSALNTATENTDVKTDFLSGKVSALTKYARGGEHFCDVVTKAKTYEKTTGSSNTTNWRETAGAINIVIKHSKNKLPIFDLAATTLALIFSVANFILFAQFAKSYGDLSSTTKARTNRLVDCTQGKKSPARRSSTSNNRKRAENF